MDRNGGEGGRTACTHRTEHDRVYMKWRAGGCVGSSGWRWWSGFPFLDMAHRVAHAVGPARFQSSRRIIDRFRARKVDSDLSPVKW